MEYEHCVKKLIAAGADVNIINQNGTTALIAAAVMQNVRSIRYLLKAKAEINRSRNNERISDVEEQFTPDDEDVIMTLFCCG